MKLLAIAGYSGSGKTTLLEKLIPILKQSVQLGVIKHSHHHIDLDQPGKDSFRLRQAGAQQTMIVCDQRWALLQETAQPADLTQLAAKFEPVDLILVEGFKHEPLPKIICHRQAVGKPLQIDTQTIAVATDQQVDSDCRQFDLNDVQAIANFILDWLQ